MTTVEQMAEAHLQTVQKAIGDLQNQKSAIDQEISKLTEYLQRGVDELNKSRASSTKVDNVEQAKQYLGD